MRPFARLILVFALLSAAPVGCKTGTASAPPTASVWHCANNDARWHVAAALPEAMVLEEAVTGAPITVGPGCVDVTLHECAREGLPWPLEATLTAADGQCWYAFSAGNPDAACDTLPSDWTSYTSLCPT